MPRHLLLAFSTSLPKGPIITCCLAEYVLTCCATDTPARTTLFNDIASYVYEQLSSARNPEGPASKRRRIDIAQHADPRANGSAPTSSGHSTAGADALADPVLLEIKDVSVTAPQRKKYDLCFTRTFLYARAPGTSVPAPGMVYPWKDVGM
jgi:hypothetical protein